MTAELSALSQAVRSHVEATQSDWLAELASLVSIPSCHDAPEALERCGLAIGRSLSKSCLEVEYLRAGVGPPVVVGWTGPESTTRLMFYGHYDVQPSGEASEWTRDPFSGETSDGRIWGRGTGDSKGQLFANLVGLRALQALDIPVIARTVVLVEGEEERGSEHLPQALRSLDEHLSPSLVMITDGSMPGDHSPTIALGCCGKATITLHATGNRAISHPSGAFRDHSARPAETLLRAVACAADVFGRDSERRLTLTALRAGEVGSSSIPPEAQAQLDLRVAPGRSIEASIEELQGRLRAVTPDVQVRSRRVLASYSCSPSTSQLHALSLCLDKAYGSSPAVAKFIASSGPSGALGQHFAAPVVTIPYAQPDQNNHGPNESMRLKNIVDAAVFAALLAAGAYETGA